MSFLNHWTRLKSSVSSEQTVKNLRERLLPLIFFFHLFAQERRQTGRDLLGIGGFGLCPRLRPEGPGVGVPPPWEAATREVFCFTVNNQKHVDLITVISVYGPFLDQPRTPNASANLFSLASQFPQWPPRIRPKAESRTPATGCERRPSPAYFAFLATYLALFVDLGRVSSFGSCPGIGLPCLAQDLTPVGPGSPPRPSVHKRRWPKGQPEVRGSARRDHAAVKTGPAERRKTLAGGDFRDRLFNLTSAE